MRVILTRHCQTISNTQDRILGWGNSPPCPDWQADVDYNRGRMRAAGVQIDAVYSSDLERARLTAKHYAASFGIAEVTSVPDLKEVNYGALQTREKSWVYAHYPQHKKDPAFVYPDGESFQQMQQRSARFLSSLALAHSDLTVLIVAHAGVIRGLVSYFLGLEYAASLQHRIPFRYLGDFLFTGVNCDRYDELGQASGFVQDGAIAIPVMRRCAAS